MQVFSATNVHTMYHARASNWEHDPANNIVDTVLQWACFGQHGWGLYSSVFIVEVAIFLLHLSMPTSESNFIPRFSLDLEPDPHERRKEGLGDRLCTRHPEHRHTSDCLGMIAFLHTFVGSITATHYYSSGGQEMEGSASERSCWSTASSSKVGTNYSRTSEQRTLWDRGLCPPFRGCPLFRGCLIFALYPPPVWFKNLHFILCDLIIHYTWIKVKFVMILIITVTGMIYNGRGI